MVVIIARSKYRQTFRVARCSEKGDTRCFCMMSIIDYAYTNQNGYNAVRREGGSEGGREGGREDPFTLLLSPHIWDFVKSKDSSLLQ